MVEAALGPAGGALHRFAGVLVFARVGQALIEHHHDVAAERELDVDGRFGGEEVRVAVEVGLEDHAILADFGELVEAEDLESAGIGEDGARPGHEFVESAEVPDGLVAGPQEEMVGVRQDDLGIEFNFDVAGEDAFQGGLRPDWHEDRGFNDAMCGVDQSRACTGHGAGCLELEMHSEV